MVTARAAVERLYCDRCDIYAVSDTAQPNHATKKVYTEIYHDAACRLSFSYISRSRGDDAAAKVAQTVKLFCAPELNIQPGARITVRHRGRCYECEGAGTAALYPTHQMIKLEKVGGWN